MPYGKKTGTGSKPRVRGRSGVMQEALEERTRSKRKTKDVRIWEERLRFAKRVAEPYFDEYGKNLDYYVGKQQPVFQTSRSTRGMVPNHSMENMLVVNRILPSLASQNAQIAWRIPWWTVSSRRPSMAPQDETYRENAEYLLNYALSRPQNDVLLQMRLGLLAAELGMAGWKVCWTPDEGVDPEADKEEVLGELVEEQDPTTGEIRVDIKGGIPKINPTTGKPIRKGRNKFVLDTRDIGDYLKTPWIDWRDCCFDPEGSNSFYSHCWFGERYSWDYDEFMANPLFTNKDEIKDAAHYVEEDYSGNWKDMRLYRASSTFARKSAPSYLQRDKMRIWGYQIWDLKKREVLYMVDGNDKLVGNEPIPKWVDFSPYVWLKFNEVIGEWWAYPDVTPARPLAASYNISRSQVMNHRRRFNRKYAVKKGSMDQTEMEKFKNPDDGTVIEVKTGGAIEPIKDAPVDNALYQDMDRDILDMSEIMGSSPEARGVADSDTATQAAIIERHGTSRENDKRHTMARALGEVGRIALNALQANLKDPIPVRVLGPQGTHWQGVVGQADITGDFEATVDLTELEPHDKKTDRQDLLALTQILGPETVLLSPTMLKRLLTSFRQYDPKVVQELHEIGVLMQVLRSSGQRQGASPSGGEARGGAKPPGRGPEGGKATEGRSAGRQERARNFGVVKGGGQ